MLKDLNAYRNTEEKFFVLDESIDPGTKFKREINTLFKTDDVRETLNKIWDSVDENAKQILLDTIDEEFLDKYATDDGSGKKKKDADEDSSEDDFKFEKDGSKLNEPDDGSNDDGNNFGDEKGTEAPADTSVAPISQDTENSNPFMAVKESVLPKGKTNKKNHLTFNKLTESMASRKQNITNANILARINRIVYNSGFDCEEPEKYNIYNGGRKRTVMEYDLYSTDFHVGIGAEYLPENNSVIIPQAFDETFEDENGYQIVELANCDFFIQPKRLSNILESSNHPINAFSHMLEKLTDLETPEGIPFSVSDKMITRYNSSISPEKGTGLSQSHPTFGDFISFLHGQKFRSFMITAVDEITIGKNKDALTKPELYQSVFDKYSQSEKNVSDENYWDAIPEIVLMMKLIDAFPDYFKFPDGFDEPYDNNILQRYCISIYKQFKYLSYM